MISEDVSIRPFQESDLAGLAQLLNDAENQKLVGGNPERKSEKKILSWLNSKKNAENIQIFAIACRDAFAGYVLITSIDTINRNAVFGINISKMFQGQGVGAAAMQHVKTFCSDQLFLRKLVLYVRADNHRAIALYERAGYKTVGRLVNHTEVDGDYFDSNVMEVFL